MLNRILVSLILLNTAIQPTAHAGVRGNDASETLVKEGNVLLAKGQYRDAVDKYLAASKTDPAASAPLSSLANALFSASLASTGDNAAKLRQQSEAAARQALSLGPNDPLAQEVLRNLLDNTPPPLHAPSQDARKLMAEGEIFFQSGKYADALQKYERAAQLDPLYSEAWVFAGDCFYMQKNWSQAEVRFRKATEIEPLHSQAWRYLADSLAAQGRKADAEEALINGIAAQPSQLPNWEKLARSRAAAGLPMKQLHLVRKVQTTTDPATGRFNITIDEAYLNEAGKDDKTDVGVWLAYAATESNLKTDNSKGKATVSPFQIELQAWRNAMQVAAELRTNAGKPLSDPALASMQMFAAANQLEPAILLLLYRESYRPELEAWKKSHPNGVKTFINAYGLRP